MDAAKFCEVRREQLDHSSKCFVLHYNNRSLISSNVMGYARVSSVKQAEGGSSLNTQILQIVRRCGDDNLICICVDAGITGSQVDNRKALLYMLDKCGPGDRIIAVDASRICRNVELAEDICEQLIENEVSLDIIDKPVDIHTEEGLEKYLEITKSYQDQSEMISRRVKAGKKYSAECSTFKYYGWRYDRGSKQPVKDPSEQLAIQNIQLIVEKNPDIRLTKLVEILTNPEYKIPPFSQERNTLPWSINNVRLILDRYGIRKINREDTDIKVLKLVLDEWKKLAFGDFYILRDDIFKKVSIKMGKEFDEDDDDIYDTLERAATKILTFGLDKEEEAAILFNFVLHENKTNMTNFIPMVRSLSVMLGIRYTWDEAAIDKEITKCKTSDSIASLVAKTKVEFPARKLAIQVGTNDWLEALYDFFYFLDAFIAAIPQLPLPALH